MKGSYHIILLFFLITSILTWKCESDQLNITQTSIPLPSKRSRNLQSSPLFTPLELYFDFTTIDNQKDIVNDPTDIKNIKKLLNEAKELFRSLIKVKRLDPKLSLGQSYCYQNITMDPIVRGEGVEADIIIFPFIDPDKSGNTLAYAGACMTYTKYRTVAGIIGFPKEALDFSVDNWKEYYLTTIIHELTHVLVFNRQAFFDFVDKNDDPIKYLPKITKTVNGIKRTLVATPRVIAAARKHFNCPTLEGVELENQGGSGTSGSHWEARVMLDDYMIGVRYSEVVISDITLALFEDSGWYKVNYYTGGLFRFGKNEGCSFINSKCIENQQTQFKEEFCTVDREAKCTNSRLAKGVCYMYDHEGLPEEYQYFSTSKGGLVLADYCPVSLVYSNETRYLNGNCQIGGLEYEQHGEVLSESSICFLSTLTKPDSVTDLNKDITICYPYKCDYSKRVITVEVFNIKIECPYEGGSVTNVEFKGSLTCPKFVNVCTAEVPCNDIVSCIKKKSVSMMSKDGYDELVDSMLQGTSNETNTTTNSGNALNVNMYITFIYGILFAFL